MAKRAPGCIDRPNRKVIVDAIRKIGNGKYRHYQVFKDWVEMLALALSNAVDKSQYERREARHLEISKRYTSEELTKIAGLLPFLVEEFCGEEYGIAFDDVLGDIFMNCNFGADCFGQYFTPYHISNCMAQMTLRDDGENGKEAIRRRGFVRAYEPCCGSGGMCVAVAEAMHLSGKNYQQHLHFVAQDIDPVCVHMTYIQLTLLHIPAIVILGNSLTGEQKEHWFTLSHIMGNWDEKLRAQELLSKMSLYLEGRTANGGMQSSKI